MALTSFEASVPSSSNELKALIFKLAAIPEMCDGVLTDEALGIFGTDGMGKFMKDSHTQVWRSGITGLPENCFKSSGLTGT